MLRAGLYLLCWVLALRSWRNSVCPLPTSVLTPENRRNTGELVLEPSYQDQSLLSHLDERVLTEGWSQEPQRFPE